MALVIQAWVGNDELGKEEIGIKRAIVDDRPFVLALTEDQANVTFLRDEEIIRRLQMQANLFGQTISLVRFSAVETLIEIKPQ